MIPSSYYIIYFFIKTIRRTIIKYTIFVGRYNYSGRNEPKINEAQVFNGIRNLYKIRVYNRTSGGFAATPHLKIKKSTSQSLIIFIFLCKILKKIIIKHFYNRSLCAYITKYNFQQ